MKRGRHHDTEDFRQKPVTAFLNIDFHTIGGLDMNERDWRPEPGKTVKLVSQKASDRERWSDRASYDAAWAARAKIAAQFVSCPVNVLDLGAGEMALSQFLPPGSDYVPADLEPLAENVIRLDLNKDQLPPGPFDIVSMLGVYEYLFEGPRVLENASIICNSLIISYCCCTQRSDHIIEDRRNLGWTTDLREDEFIGLVIESGFYFLDAKLFNTHEGCEQKVFHFCTQPSLFKPTESMASALQRHGKILINSGQVTRWYEFLLKLRGLQDVDLNLEQQIFEMAKKLNDLKMTAETGAILAGSLNLQSQDYLLIAKAFAQSNKPLESIYAILICALQDNPPDRRILLREARNCLSPDHLELRPWKVNFSDRLPINIRPDLPDLQSNSRWLLQSGFENLSHQNQLAVIDSVDLGGDSTTATELYSQVGLGEAEKFNLNTMARATGAISSTLDTGEESPADYPQYGLLSYRTENIGDEIQSLAALRLLPEHARVVLLDRDDLGRSPHHRVQLIMNGWFGHMHEHKKESSWPPHPSIDPIMVSLHITPNAAPFMLSKEGIQYLKRHEPIGCRDQYTCSLLSSRGIEAWMSGCLTSTFQLETSQKRSDDIFLVDLYNPTVQKAATEALDTLGLRQVFKRTHDIRVGRLNPWSRLKLACTLLSDYARAGLVITSRLHCALPCIAMGTPVIFVIDNVADARFTGLELGTSAMVARTFARSAKELIADSFQKADHNIAHPTELEKYVAERLRLSKMATPLSLEKHLINKRFTSGLIWQQV